MKLPRRLSKPGPLLEHLGWLHNVATRSGAKDQVLKVQETVSAIRAMLATREGAIFLELLEKSTLERSLPIDAPRRALVALNAQSFIAHDLRRIMSDELDAVFEGPKDVEHTGRRRRKPRV